MEDAPSAHTRLRTKCCAESLPSPRKSPPEDKKLPFRSDRVLRGSRRSFLLRNVDDKSVVNDSVQNGKSEVSSKGNKSSPEKKAMRSGPTKAEGYLGEDSPKTPRRYRLSLSENRLNTRSSSVNKSLPTKSSENHLKSRRSLRIRSSERTRQNKSSSEKRNASCSSDSECDNCDDIPLKKYKTSSTTESRPITLRKNESGEKNEVCAGNKGGVLSEVSVPVGDDKKETKCRSPSDTLSTRHQEISHLSTQSPPNCGDNNSQDSTTSDLFLSTSGITSSIKKTSVTVLLERLPSDKTCETNRANLQCVGTRKSLRSTSYKRAPQVDLLSSGDSSDDTFEEIAEVITKGSKTSLHKKREKFVIENMDVGDNVSDSLSHELIFSDDTNNNQDVRSLQENNLCTSKKVGEEYSSLVDEVGTQIPSAHENDSQLHVTSAENPSLQESSSASSSSEHSVDKLCEDSSSKEIVSSERGQFDDEITGGACGVKLQSLENVYKSTVNLSLDKGLVAGDDEQHAENPELGPDSCDESESDTCLPSAGNARLQNDGKNEQEKNDGIGSRMESATQYEEENITANLGRPEGAGYVKAMDVIVLDSDVSSEFSIFEMDASKIGEIVQNEKSDSMETDVIEVRGIVQGDDSESIESEKEKDETVDEKQKDETESEKEKNETEDEKEKDETEDEKEKDETEDEKEKDETEDEKEKDKIEGEKEKEETEDAKVKEETEDEKVKEETEDEKEKGETEDEKQKDESDDDGIEVIEVNLMNKQKTGQDGSRNKNIEKKYANKHKVASLQTVMSPTSWYREEHFKNKVFGKNAPTPKVSSDLHSVNSLKFGMPAVLNRNTSANSQGGGHGGNKDGSISQKTQFSTKWYLNSSVATYSIAPKNILSPDMNSESKCEGCNKVKNSAKESLNAATKPKKRFAVAAAKVPNSNFSSVMFSSKEFVDSDTVLNVPEKNETGAEANCKPSKSSSSKSLSKFADGKFHLLGVHRSAQTESEGVGKRCESMADAKSRKKMHKNVKMRVLEGMAERTGSDFKRASKEDDDPISPGDFVASRTLAHHFRQQQEKQLQKKLRRKRFVLLRRQEEEKLSKLKKPAVNNNNAFGSSLESSVGIQEKSDATPRIHDVVLPSTKITKKERMSGVLHHITKKKKKKKSLMQNAGAETFKCQATTQWTVEDVSRSSSKLRRLPEAVINQLDNQQSRRLLHETGKIGKVRQKRTKEKRLKNTGLFDDFRVTTDTEFIPLKTGTTVQFGVMPLDKMTKAASALAKVPANFRNSMLYGSHVRREPAKTLLDNQKKLKASRKDGFVQFARL